MNMFKVIGVNASDHSEFDFDYFTFEGALAEARAYNLGWWKIWRISRTFEYVIIAQSR